MADGQGIIEKALGDTTKPVGHPNIDKVYDALADQTQGTIHYKMAQSREEFFGAMGDPAVRQRVYGGLKQKYPNLLQTPEEFEKTVAAEAPTFAMPPTPSTFKAPITGETTLHTTQGLQQEPPKSDILGDVKPLKGVVYPLAWGASAMERPVANVLSLVNSVTRTLYSVPKLPFESEGFYKDRMASKAMLDDLQKTLSNPPLSTRVDMNRKIGKENAYSISPVAGVAYDTLGSISDVARFILGFRAFELLSPSKISPLVANPARVLKDMGKNAAKFSGYVFATTAGSPRERFESALYGLGYSMSPLLATSVTSGVPAVLLNTAINMFISSPQYIDTARNSGDIVEFMSNTIPQAALDAGLSLSARKMPMRDRIAAFRDRRVEFDKQYPSLKMTDESIKSLFMTMDKVERDLAANTARGAILRKIEARTQDYSKAVRGGVDSKDATILSQLGMSNIRLGEDEAGKKLVYWDDPLAQTTDAAYGPIDYKTTTEKLIDRYSRPEDWKEGSPEEMPSRRRELVREYNKVFDGYRSQTDVEMAEVARLKEKYPELTPMEAKIEEEVSSRPIEEDILATRESTLDTPAQIEEPTQVNLNDPTNTPVSSINDVADIQPIRDTPRGVEADPAAPNLRKQLFAIMKEKRISKRALYNGLNGIGVKDLKFVGENAITAEQLGELMARMRRIRPLWPENLKNFYLVHGDLPMPDTGVVGPMDLGKGGQVVNAMRELRIKFAQSIGTTLDKLGPIGQEIATRTRQALQYKDREFVKTSHLVDRIFSPFSDKEMKEFIIAVKEGRAISVSKKFSDTFAPLSDKFREVDTLAKIMKFWTRSSDGKSYPYKGLGEKFWPQVFEWDWMKSERKRERVIRGWMKRNKMTREQAETQLEILTEERTGRLSNSLEYARDFDLGGWLGDPTSSNFSKKEAIVGLKKYFMEAYSRIGEATFFDKHGKEVMGKDWKSVAELVAGEPNRDKRVLYSEIIKRIRGLDPASRERVLLSAIRNMNIIRLLGFAQIPNVFQNTITTMPRIMQLGMMRGVRVLYDGIKLAMTNKNFALEEVGSNAVQNMREVTGLSSRGITGRAATQFLRITGFSASESANNIVAASVGSPYIKELFRAAKGESPSTIFGVTFRRMNSNRIKQMAIKEMGKLGVPFEEFASLKELPRDMVERAAWRLARSTQFGGGVLDLPMFWSSDYGRFFTQFKTFSFNIVKHTYQHILPPAKEFFASGGTRGSLLPMVAFLGASISSGEIIALIRQTWMKGSDRPENLLMRGLEDLMYAGTLGLWMDILYAVKGGRPLEFVFGPTAGWVAETVEAGRRGNVGRLVKQNVPFYRSVGGGKKREERIF